MNDESDVVLVKRKVNGTDAAVRMDKAKYDADPSAYELWDKKAGKKEDDEPVLDPKNRGFSMKKNGKRGAASKWLVLNPDGTQNTTEEFDTEANAQAWIDLVVASLPAVEG